MSIGKKYLNSIKLREYRLIICGGGHVSIPMIQMGKMLGFRVSVLEDRPTFANHARTAGADQVICDSFENGLLQIVGDSDTYFVIVTRGHRYDMACLRSIIIKENAYIGMMGSKVRVNQVMHTLSEEGMDSNLLERVHSPIGLAIGAQTPEEIAISVMAEIIQIRNKDQNSNASDRDAVDGYTKEILAAALSEVPNKRCIATILSKKGSAPRRVGTKMVIFEDGTLAGTIGGGCMEAEVIREALDMMKQNADHKNIEINLLPEQAETEGMICGGVIEVILEAVEI